MTENDVEMVENLLIFESARFTQSGRNIVLAVPFRALASGVTEPLSLPTEKGFMTFYADTPDLTMFFLKM